MGAWDTGPFDNDSAADFASDVGGLITVEKRQRWIQQALQAVRDGAGREIEEGYEFPYEIEFAIAGAAFLADAHTGRKDFTDTVYAKLLDETKNFKDDEAWLPIDLGTPSQELVDLAALVTEQIVARLVEARVEEAWVEPSRKILAALCEKRG